MMKMLTCAGSGLCFLPCYVGDLEPSLERLTGVLPEFTYDVWLLTHPDLRYTARIRAFMDFVAQAFEREADLFAGRRGNF